MRPAPTLNETEIASIAVLLIKTVSSIVNEKARRFMMVSVNLLQNTPEGYKTRKSPN